MVWSQEARTTKPTGSAKVFYVVRFNVALAALGIEPTRVPANMRMLGQAAGKDAGCTPEEAALLVLGELPLWITSGGDTNVVQRWIEAGKVRRENPAIDAALINLGWAL